RTGARHYCVDMTRTTPLSAAATFLTGHARLLDRHRYGFLVGRGDPRATLAGLAAYRNTDGGYGHGLEPDLRSPESQPAAALHAFEVLAEIDPVTSPQAEQLCDWLLTVTLPDGGLPCALPVTEPENCAPFWSGRIRRRRRCRSRPSWPCTRTASHSMIGPWPTTRGCRVPPSSAWRPSAGFRRRTGSPTPSNWPSPCGSPTH